MTDARMPERWLLDRRLNRASDPAHRTFINVLLYAVANRTDGVVDLADLELIPRARSECVPELARLGLVTVDGDQLTLVDWNATQTSRSELEVLENNRRRDREKKARQRAEKGDVPGDSPPGSPPGRVPGTAQAGRKAGQAGNYEGEINGDGERVDDWPAVTEPSSAGPSDPGMCRRCGEPLPRGLVQLGRTEHIDRCAP